MNDAQIALLTIVVSMFGGFLALRHLLAFGIQEYFRVKRNHLLSMVQMGPDPEVTKGETS